MINYEGDVVLVDVDTILAQAREHWTLWLSKCMLTVVQAEIPVPLDPDRSCIGG